MKQIESEKHLERLLKNTVEGTMNGLCLKLLSQHITGLPDRLCILPGGKAFFRGGEDHGEETPQDPELYPREAEETRIQSLRIRLIPGAPYYINRLRV